MTGESDPSSIVGHYGGQGLLAAIEAGLATLGKTTDTARVDDLALVDEFHIGGRAATIELCRHLELRAAHDLLDVGSGIGGAARFLASTFGCRTTGLDLTPAYVETARTLTDWTGLGDRVTFEVGSALEMPFADGSFDRVIQLHVGMNISNKGTLFGEIARVLRPGGRVGVYDIVRRSDGDITYPVPWASERSQSFVDGAAGYREALGAAGFEVTEHDRREFALDFFARQAVSRATGPPPLGLHLIIGTDAAAKLGHLRQAIVDGVLAPMEFIGELPG